MEEQVDDEIVLEDEDETQTDTVKKLRERLKKTVAEKQEYLEGWQRARADFANEKRDMEARRGELVADVKAKVAEKLLPLVDTFKQALAQESFSKLDDSWQKGITSLQDEALRVLKELGVEPFNPIGEQFDPASMHAVREMEGEPNTVLAVERQGFKMNDKVIREAYVTVGK